MASLEGPRYQGISRGQTSPGSARHQVMVEGVNGNQYLRSSWNVDSLQVIIFRAFSVRLGTRRIHSLRFLNHAIEVFDAVSQLVERNIGIRLHGVFDLCPQLFWNIRVRGQEVRSKA